MVKDFVKIYNQIVLLEHLRNAGRRLHGGERQTGGKCFPDFAIATPLRRPRFRQSIHTQPGNALFSF